MKHKLILPLRVAKTKTKDFILNLNNYRNTHYQTLNKTKINFKLHMQDQLDECPKFKAPVMIKYKLFPATKRLCDLDNVMAVQKKYLQDALAEAGIIEDDTYDILIRNVEEFGEIDRDNPRVEATIIQL